MQAFAPAKRPGYSGVGILSRVAPSKVETSLGDPRFDDEGRFIVAYFGRLAIASVYFPRVMEKIEITPGSATSWIFIGLSSID
jgi:exonuclease III